MNDKLFEDWAKATYGNSTIDDTPRWKTLPYLVEPMVIHRRGIVMQLGVTKTGSMYHALYLGVMRCDGRKRPHRTVELEQYPHMFCNLCARIVGKPLKPQPVWFYQI